MIVYEKEKSMSGKRTTLFITLFLLLAFVTVHTGCDKEEAPDVSEQAVSSDKPSELSASGDWMVLSEDSALNAWIMRQPGAWNVEEGVMAKSEGGGDIWTKERFGDFVLDCEFKISKNGNSGIFFRTDDISDPVQTGIEMQVYNIERKQKPVKNDCGAVYDLKEPREYADKPAGEWNHVVIMCTDNIITIVMNDIQIIDMNIDHWDTPGMNPDGTENKFQKALKDFKREGHIGFQEHGDPVWYRNVKIRKL